MEKERYKGKGEGYDDSSEERFSLFCLAIDTAQGLALYTLCRKLRPDVVVETGVASGVSSSYILCALEENKHGQLYSIDIPWHTIMTRWSHYFPVEDMSKVMPQEKQSGWIIPDYLRNRWQLIFGNSSEELSPLLEKLRGIDVFLHDSQHTYENQRWEFQIAWAYLKTGGLLLAHNISSSDAFSDLCRNMGVKGCFLTEMGGIVRS